MLKLRRCRRKSLLKGMVAGMCAGLAGTVAMTQFQNAWSAAGKQLGKEDENTQATQNSKGTRGQDETSENATTKTAANLAGLFGYHLSVEQKRKAGAIVHYAFGTLMGGVYGAALEVLPRGGRNHASLSGIALGGALFVGADEVAVSKLGLSSGDAPLGAHIYGLASHLIYGVTTGWVCEFVRKRSRLGRRAPSSFC